MIKLWQPFLGKETSMDHCDQKMVGQHIRALVFDFDNVIVRGSERCKEEAWNSLFEEGSLESITLQKERAHYAHGMGDRFDILSGVYGAQKDDGRVTAASERFDVAVQQRILSIGIASEDMEALVSLSRVYPLYIISATPQTALRATLGRLSELHKVDLLKIFKLTLGTPMSKPENFERVHEHSGVDYASMLMIGDGMNDYEAARTMGTLFLGIITDENHSRWNDAPFTTCASINALPEILRLPRNPS